MTQTSPSSPPSLKDRGTYPDASRVERGTSSIHILLYRLYMCADVSRYLWAFVQYKFLKRLGRLVGSVGGAARFRALREGSWIGFRV